MTYSHVWGVLGPGEYTSGIKERERRDRKRWRPHTRMCGTGLISFRASWFLCFADSF